MNPDLEAYLGWRCPKRRTLGLRRCNGRKAIVEGQQVSAYNLRPVFKIERVRCEHGHDVTDPDVVGDLTVLRFRLDREPDPVPMDYLVRCRTCHRETLTGLCGCLS